LDLKTYAQCIQFAFQGKTFPEIPARLYANTTQAIVIYKDFCSGAGLGIPGGKALLPPLSRATHFHIHKVIHRLDRPKAAHSPAILGGVYVPGLT
jgi:hypothetical protein